MAKNNYKTFCLQIKIEMNYKLYSISNAFWHNILKSVTNCLQTSTTTMASVSQNLPRTFYKLAEKWDKKVGTRNFEAQGCWSAASCDLKDHAYKVASMMSDKLALMTPDQFSTLSSECVKTSSDQVWIYDMRHSDTLPKSPADSQRLYNFVKLLVLSAFETKDKNYLLDHNHITTCFFVWYFTKPNFFFKDKMMRQTTRNGIQRVWTPLILKKKPKTQTTSIAVSVPKISSTTDALLPKQQQQQTKLKNDIQALVNGNLEWEDPLAVHIKISEIIASSDSGLSIKQNKKLQKLYSDYTTVTAKINKTMLKIKKVEHANSKIVFTPLNSPEFIDKLGPPPDSPPELVRQSADELGYEDTKCAGCEGNQPNQEAHMGGCLPDLDAEEVPDSWEDL